MGERETEIKRERKIDRVRVRERVNKSCVKGVKAKL